MKKNKHKTNLNYKKRCPGCKEFFKPTHNLQEFCESCKQRYSGVDPTK